METAVQYFIVFGGLNIKIDTTKPLLELIEKHILNEYTNLRYEINTISGGYKVDHAILTGIAQGDRRTNSSFKRAFVSFEEGMKCVEKLVDRGLIEIESSQHHLAKKRGDDKISKKLLFTTPFLRFWFAFVSPIYKGIKEKEYKEFYELYENKQAEFGNFIFEELAMECLRDSFVEDPVKQFGKYWDEKVEIDLVAKTTSGKIIAGNCKYINSKLKKNELNKLKEDCKIADLNVDIFVIFSKNGFSNELKSQKSETLRLFTPKSFKLLLA
ncbi:DUF234 domain-containing protein [Arcobacter suis]|uniref:DUF234 domain-containing protein n=1 Tax=Arcobacter suis CECT 7833 TaxID=663365 RepID=A0AAD0WQT6_9BACT|nr:DUF234 domain-containing protein [Arcobacter suis]AXX89622.1 DUF234 domain-containing protein [Arcobacter suis CECT 7833]